MIPVQIRCDKATRAHPDHACAPACEDTDSGVSSSPSPEQAAAQSGTTIPLLDTQTGSAAEALYRTAGWTAAGVIPDYAAGPTCVLYPTTLFCKAVT